MNNSVTNAFTVDVEDYFQVAAFDRCIDRNSWDTRECRIEQNLEKMLALLSRNDTKATFFTLGWIAKRYPHLVRQMVKEGHEIASHGYDHQKATTQSPEQVREDLLRAKGILQDLSGQVIRGYRAPSFSIGRDNLWVHDLLAETGHEYSSSVYPVHHDHYGMPEADRFASATPSGLLEIPLTTAHLFNTNIPAAGGGYFRLIPYSGSRWLIKHVNRTDGQPAVFYCHPWEIDSGQPRMAEAPLKARFRHYVNIGKTESRLDRLLKDFNWDRIDRVFADQLSPPEIQSIPSESVHAP